MKTLDEQCNAILEAKQKLVDNIQLETRHSDREWYLINEQIEALLDASETIKSLKLLIERVSP